MPEKRWLRKKVSRRLAETLSGSSISRTPTTYSRSKPLAGLAGLEVDLDAEPVVDGTVEVGEPGQFVGHLELAVLGLDLVLRRGERDRAR